MHQISPLGNLTQLVFCRENVDPDVVSRMLGLTPSEAIRVGEVAERWNGTRYTSHLGLWKMSLPKSDPHRTIEEQIGSWIELLQPRSLALNELRGLGYAPYLDCKGEKGSLSVCMEPDVLTSLGELKISLSIWLHEQPAQTLTSGRIIYTS